MPVGRLEAYNKDAITAETDAYQTFRRVFAYISVNAKCISWRIYVHNCYFGPCVREERVHQIRDVLRKRRRILRMVYLFIPITEYRSESAFLYCEEKASHKSTHYCPPKVIHRSFLRRN